MRTSFALAAVAALSAVSVSSSARAQQAAPDVMAVVVERTPDPRVLTGGLVLFGITYGPSVVVAARSDVESDRFLYVPVAGPWIDLVRRPDCDTNEEHCSKGGATAFTLIGDGILQTAAAALVVRSFTSPQKTWLIRGDRARATLAPTLGRAPGIAAIGEF